MKEVPNLSVPHMKQTKESSCGAAALAMLYKHLGIPDQTEEVIWERLKTPRPNIPGDEFITTMSMAQDGQQFDLSYFKAQASLASSETAMQPVVEFLSQGIPVVVCQKVSKDDIRGHFRILTGVEGESILLNDPDATEATTKMDLDTFMSLWSDANNGEVIGGEFFAIFKKEQLAQESRFTVTNFNSSVDSFDVSNLNLS
ncbi:C39 family peptidase [Candidatus Parcubacteria bacterium]|nr:C39 family peptidase [Candidatus Parcubacteria bacterium]